MSFIIIYLGDARSKRKCSLYCVMHKATYKHYFFKGRQLKEGQLSIYTISIGKRCNLFELYKCTLIACWITVISGHESSNIIADVVFVMDSSSTVPLEDYRKEKEFVKYLARYLNVSPGNSRSALITYGDTAAEVVGFDIRRSVSDFETAVDKAPFVSGERRIDRALDNTSQIMANARQSATKIVVLLTSGKQASASGSKTPGEAAIPLREGDVYSYVVAIGQDPDISELRPVVQELSHIFRMGSFDDLEPRRTTVAQIIVETSSKLCQFLCWFSLSDISTS